MASELLKTYEEEGICGKKQLSDYLEITGKHYKENQYYYVSIQKVTQDGISTSYMPFADGNFSVKVGNGRKSAKKLDTINNIISDNMPNLSKMWKEGKYTDLASKIKELTCSVFTK